MLKVSSEFFQQLNQEIASAQRSVYIQSLTLEVGEVMDLLTPTLIAAAKRGVHVELHIDWIAQDYVHGKISLTPEIRLTKRAYARDLHRRNQAMVDQLRQVGAQIVWVNRPNWLAKILPIAGRNHIKLYMVDEKVVWIGGVNVLDLSLNHLDFMVSFENKQLISSLKQVFFATRQHDEIVPFTPENTLLVDGGRRKTSIIYDEALKMIAKAETSITFMSQFVPEGKLLSALTEKAKVGCKVTVLTSPKSMMQFSQWPYKVTYLKCKQTLAKVDVPIVHLDRKVHAKLLIVDQKQALFGSHNLVETGINLGTAEIAIQTTEPLLTQQLIAWVTWCTDTHSL